MQQAEVLTYLTEAAEPPIGARFRVGDRVELRRSRKGPAFEAWSPAGQRLGRLPLEESVVLDGLLGASGVSGPAPGQPRVTAEIAALVPRPRGGGADRIHIRVLAG